MCTASANHLIKGWFKPLNVHVFCWQPDTSPPNLRRICRLDLPDYFAWGLCELSHSNSGNSNQDSELLRLLPSTSGNLPNCFEPNWSKLAMRARVAAFESLWMRSQWLSRPLEAIVGLSGLLNMEIPNKSASCIVGHYYRGNHIVHLGHYKKDHVMHLVNRRYGFV